MPKYLQKRRRRWYAILEIPKELRKTFGRARFVQSLETESLSVAERRVLPIVTAWKKDIAQVKNESPGDDDAAYWNRKLRHAKSEEEKASILEQIEYAAWEIGAVNVDKIGQQPSSAPEAIEFHARSTGQLTGFKEHVDEWFATANKTEKTIDMNRKSINRFAEKFKMVQDVNKPEIRRWVDKLMTEEGLSPKTVQSALSPLRGYWRYLQAIGIADESQEPFSKLDVAYNSKRSNPKSVRLPFEKKEVLVLLNKAIEQEDHSLADLIRLGMWTGCRIDELCSLKTDEVHKDYFTVEDAKTAAGCRDVPIHSELRPTIERLVDESRDGYLLTGLTENKYGSRSNGIGKRFGRLKTKSAFGKQHVFHSIRKTVITILENANVPENVVADIVGHEKTTMTYGLYSGGVNIKLKKNAIESLTYK